MDIYLTQSAKPFLKWAGGKRQLLQAIDDALPVGFRQQKEITYLEPFVGGGAVLFWLLQHHKGIKNAFINDLNSDLINTYRLIQKEPFNLINKLESLQNQYWQLKQEDDRRKFYDEKRLIYNYNESSSMEKSALLIFLNKTCFNGLYRVNSKNKFNVPFGKYIKPMICDRETIIADHSLLQRVTILEGDFSNTLCYAEKNSFFYLDPPYKPLNQTSNFNSYASESFDDASQERLAAFCRKLDTLGYRWLLSNTDLQSIDENNTFFEKLYKGFYLDTVLAKRAINSKAEKRGHISEILISNYPRKQKEVFTQLTLSL